MKSIKILRTILLATLSVIIPFSGCKKFIDVGAPITSINANNVYTTDATAISVLTGIYTTLSQDNYSSFTTSAFSGITLFTALSSDELRLVYNNQNLAFYYTNSLSPNVSVGMFWKNIYPVIFTCNSAISGLNASNSLTPAVKQQLLGEAKFMRAFCYFYLVNLYGDVPLIITTDYKINKSVAKSAKSLVYEQIIADLTDAQTLLSPNYLKADLLSAYPAISAERVRPSKWAAMALLARVYLYKSDYSKADIAATGVINASTLYSLPALNDVFLKNSAETIWALQPVNNGSASNTGDGAVFVLPSTGPNGDYPVTLSTNLMNSFELGDKRKENWTNNVIVGADTFYYPYKYKIGQVLTPTSEYSIILRLSEQYLIRAEARVNEPGSAITGGVSDLNYIRTRAGLPNTTANDKLSLLAAIQHERQVELFTEWGHRWFDLKRTNNIDTLMNKVSVQKGGTWSSYKALYPIPQSEISTDPYLVQNPGY